MKRLLSAFALLLAAPTALADQPSVTVDRSGVTITSAQSVKVEYGPDGSVRISWVGQAPAPVVPLPDPKPTPVPTPVPTPTPPAPKPVEPPAPPQPEAPIPAPGLRVLMIYDVQGMARMPLQQFVILGSAPLREYMGQVCAKGPDGNLPEWRVYASTADLSNESETWRKAMARPRQSLPWIIVSNGKAGHEGPLPGNVDDTKALISKYVEVK